MLPLPLSSGRGGKDITGSLAPGFSSHAAKIRPKSCGRDGGKGHYSQNTLHASYELYSYEPNRNNHVLLDTMKHSTLAHNLDAYVFPPGGSSFSSILWALSYQVSLCSDATAPDAPPEPMEVPPILFSVLFSIASTTISECAGHVFIFLVSPTSVPLEDKDGVSPSSHCTAQTHACTQRELEYTSADTTERAVLMCVACNKANE